MKFLCYLLIAIMCQKCFTISEDKDYWRKLAQIELEEALSQKPNTGVAKNVIIFIGDGMGLTTTTASRIYDKTERGYLAFEKFPYTSALKTYSSNKLVGDSSSAATAIFCGIKANQQTVGVDATVPAMDCEASLNEEAQMESIVNWAQQAGKATGFATTARVTHATPSALYASSSNRYWECEASKPTEASKCKDIARQLVEDLPGRDINVIMGGGRQSLVSDIEGSSEDPILPGPSYSRDGRNLIESWKIDKIDRNLSYAILANNEDLKNVDPNARYVLGIFANNHLPYDYKRKRGPKGVPSLTNMTEKAIEILRKNDNGFLLMVESGRIDHGNHIGVARTALSETVEFSNAIEKAVELTQNEKMETLIIVMSDHDQALLFTGYPGRTESILDVSSPVIPNEVPYTYLLYSTGTENNFQFTCENNTVIRRNPRLDDTRSFDYHQQTAVVSIFAHHSGADVLAYATGPMAHLLTSVREQTFIAYVVAYAAKIGPFKESSSCKRILQPFVISCTIVITILFI